jgi:hypothetical protein
LNEGDKTGAIAVWRSFLAENPFSPERGTIIDSLAAQGAAPSDQSLPAKAGVRTKTTVTPAQPH